MWMFLMWLFGFVSGSFFVFLVFVFWAFIDDETLGISEVERKMMPETIPKDR